MEGERLAVSDTANNRVLIWDRTPGARAGCSADHVLGQDHFGANGENRWKAVTHDSLCWPYAICLHRDRLAVADSGNNRVMLRIVPQGRVEPKCASQFQDVLKNSSKSPALEWVK
jgi:hypothetical protein